MLRIFLSLLLSLWALSANAQGYLTPITVSPNSLGQLPSMGGGVSPSTLWVTTPASTQSISSTSDTSCFSSTGKGPGQTITPVANIPYQGNLFVMECEGVYSSPVINTLGIIPKIKWGSVTVAGGSSSSGVQASASNFQWRLSAKCQVVTVSATPNSSTVSCWGTFSYAQSVTGSAPVITSFQSASPVTVDTTSPFKIDMTMAWSGSPTTQSATSLAGNLIIFF